MLQNNHHNEGIYSRLCDDPDLLDILEMFVEEMPGRVEALLRHLEDKNWESLRRTAHQIKGAAGSYGFEVLTPVAARVEHAIRDNEPEERLCAAVMELVDLCRRVRHGRPAEQLAVSSSPRL